MATNYFLDAMNQANTQAEQTATTMASMQAANEEGHTTRQKLAQKAENHKMEFVVEQAGFFGNLTGKVNMAH